MTVTVELFRRDLAEVTLRPSWWRRLFLRQDTVLLFAVRSATGVWRWDYNRNAIVDRRVLAKLDEAIKHADFDAIARALARARLDYAVDDPNEN